MTRRDFLHTSSSCTLISLFLLSCFIFVFLLLPPTSDAIEFGELIVNDEAVAKKWVKASAEFDNLLFPYKGVIIETLNDVVGKKKHLRLSHACASSLGSLSQGLSGNQMWAYQFMDASGKGKSGFTYGYISDLGNFDQCIGLESENTPNRKEFRGQYCMVDVKFPLAERPERNFLRPMKLNLSTSGLGGSLYEFYGNHTELFFYDTFSFGICIPSTCSRKELSLMLDHVFKGYQLDIYPRKYCEVSRSLFQIFMSKPWDVKVAVLMIAFLTWLAAMSTLMNYFLPGIPHMSNFCVLRNTRKLTADYSDPSMKKLMFFDTFKCFFQLGGTLAHIICFLPAVPAMFAVIQDRDKDQRDLWLLSQFFQKAIYFTQVILVISGFFTSYYMLPVLDKSKGKLHFLPYVIKRWFRTAPTLAGGMLCMFALSGLIYGPVAEEINENYLNPCRRTWLYTIFNMNNFHVTDEICLPQTWTQSADFHLWIMAYFPLLWLYKNPKKGERACLAIIAAGVVIPAVVIYIKDLPSPVGLSRPLEILFLIIHGKYFPIMAYHTYNNVSNYFIGLLLGYYCYRNIQFDPKKVFMFNIFSWVFIIACFIGPYYWIHEMGREFGNVANAIYAGIFKVTYGLVFGCCIYNTYYHYKLFLAFWVVETKWGVLMGRLALSIYVSQLAPIGYYMAMSYDPFPVNWYTLFMRISSIMVQIIALGYIVFLLFEAPFLNFSKNFGFKNGSKEVRPEMGIHGVMENHPNDNHDNHDISSNHGISSERKNA